MTLVKDASFYADVLEGVFKREGFGYFEPIARRNGLRLSSYEYNSGFLTIQGAGFLTFHDNGWMVACLGTDSRHALNFLKGYRNAKAMDTFLGFNTYSAQDALTLLQSFLPGDSVRRGPGRCAGHSAGSVVNEALLAYLGRVGVNPAPSIFTYGAPKPGNNGCCLTLSGVSRTRIVLRGDPVPNIPYYVQGGAVSIALGFTFRDYAPWRTAHPCGGIRLSPDGSFEPLKSEEGTIDPSGEDVAHWLASQDQGPSSRHSIAAYASALRRAAENEDAQEFPRPLPFSPHEPYVNLAMEFPPRDLVPDANVVPVLAIRDGRVGLRGPTNRPLGSERRGRMGISKVDKKLLAAPVRIGQTYWVYWFDQPIMQSPTFGRAKTMARKINSMLRYMGTTVVISAESFPSALNDYLGTASIAGLGCVPPINVE
jgi:hypothetical protein